MNFKNGFLRLGANLALLFLALYVYGKNSPVYHMHVTLNVLRLEVPLILFVFFLLYFPNKRFVATLGAWFIICTVYFASDIFSAFLMRPPRLSDLENANALFEFSVFYGVLFYAMWAVLGGIFLYGLVSFVRNYARKTVYAVLGAKIALLGLGALLVYSGGLKAYLFAFYEEHSNGIFGDYAKNGRMASVAYYYYKGLENAKALQKYRGADLNANALLFGSGAIKDKRNVYILVLESFLDPRLIKGIKFSADPLFSGLRKYLHGGEFSRCISPVYGGGTAQAEFEVLTAIPALSKIRSIDFNALGGHQTNGLIKFFKDNGYAEHATIGTKYTYFNSINAYRSIGFGDLKFLEWVGIKSDEFAGALFVKDEIKKPGDNFIFDGDLYDYAVKKIRTLEADKPHVFYVLGMYGHATFDRNKKARPDVTHTNIGKESIENIANQFYYRTKALAGFIDAVLE